MMREPRASAPSTGATQGRWIAGILIATLLAWALVSADLAVGGRPDPTALRAAATLLDGPWQFRTGDDPRWAMPATDDPGWETIDMTAPPGSHDGDVGLPDYVGGWMAHGHPGYHGYAWYRRTVAVPTGNTSWELLGPTLVEDGYELYWNGRRLGGSGRLGASPRLVGTRPLRFALPAGSAGTRGVLAIRTYMLPGSAAGADSGGMHTAPILAPSFVGTALHRAQWQRTIAGYIVEVVEPVAMLALIGMAFVWRRRSKRGGFLVWAGIALALMAARRLSNAVVAWTDLEDLATYTWLASVMWIPMTTAWTWAWNRWCTPPWRGVDAVAAVLGVAAFVGVQTHSAFVTQGSRLGSIALLILLGARIVRNGPLRVGATVTLASIVLALFGPELLDTIGVPGIWFPFGIGVSRTQYVYAAMITLLAVLIVRSEQREPGQ